jgi:hypothetical protein
LTKEESTALTALDISHNLLTVEGVKSIVKMLQSNESLETLVAEYCDGLTHEVMMNHFIPALPNFKGLRHLHMDGNKFAEWSGMEEEETGERINPEYAELGSSLAKAMGMNTKLTVLKAGRQYGGYCCCTTPPHCTGIEWEAEVRDSFLSCLDRNQLLEEETRHAKANEDMVRFSTMMLNKILLEQECS